jgi:diguanylate cyclase (GGDEF)-like protein
MAATRKRAQRPDSPALKRAEGVLKASPPPQTLLDEFALLTKSFRALESRLYKTVRISDGYQQQVKEMAASLETMAVKMHQLREVALPICVHCHKVRAGDDYWQRLETYFASNADIMFAQGICPDCIRASHASISASGESQGPKARFSVPRRSKSKADQKEDPLVRDFRVLAAGVSKAAPDYSFELEAFVDRFAKLSRRFTKTLTISDSYQSQLRDLNLRLEVLARTDLLTGLANRWEMASRLEAERCRMERHGPAFSIILGDIDHFKTVNDAHGHLGGDATLRGVANVLRKNLRGEDLCARWGGEEFMILLPQTDLADAKVVADKLCSRVRANATAWEGKRIAVTMSFGVGCIQPGMTVDEGIRKVDDALYAAKAQGRDTVVAAGE